MATAAGLLWDETIEAAGGRAVEDFEVHSFDASGADALAFDGAQQRPGRRAGLESDGVPAVRGFLYDGACCGRAVRAGLSRRGAYGGSLPMESLGLFRKEIGNQALRRRSSSSSKSSWKHGVSWGFAAPMDSMMRLNAWHRSST